MHIQQLLVDTTIHKKGIPLIAVQNEAKQKTFVSNNIISTFSQLYKSYILRLHKKANSLHNFLYISPQDVKFVLFSLVLGKLDSDKIYF